MMQKYYPSLLIGCGGTGVRTLRYVLGQAEYDEDLKEMLHLGAIELLALDTDPKANDRELQVDPLLVWRSKVPPERQERCPKRLPIIDNWVNIRREAVNNALPVATADVKSIQEMVQPDWWKGDMRHPHIADWFPMEYPEKGAMLTVGASKNAGASQWRPLGRMGFFQSYHQIKKALDNAIRRSSKHSGADGVFRVSVVCSLAGGTGSGLFWDTIFLVHMLAKDVPIVSVSGIFLLDGPFSGVDQAGRIGTNVYAALKELTNYKNWLQRDAFAVEYPDGKRFETQPGGPPVIDQIYLYQSFPAGDGVKDQSEGTINATCFRLSQNILAQLRTDLHLKLDVSKNNVAGDANALPGQREARYVFSTSATIPFPDPVFYDLEAFFKFRWLEGQIEEVRPRGYLVWERFLAELKVKDAEVEAEGNPLRALAVLQRQAMAEKRPAFLNRLLDEVRQGQNDLLELRGKKIQRGDLNGIFRQRMPEEVRRQWFQKGWEAGPDQEVVAEISDPDKELEELAEEMRKELSEGLQRLHAYMKEHRLPMTGEVEKAVAAMIRQLEEWQQKKTAAMPVFKVAVHKVFHRIKYHLPAPAGCGHNWWRRFQVWIADGNVPVEGKHRDLEALFSSLANQLHARGGGFVGGLEEYLQACYGRKAGEQLAQLRALQRLHQEFHQEKIRRDELVAKLMEWRGAEVPSTPGQSRLWELLGFLQHKDNLEDDAITMRRARKLRESVLQRLEAFYKQVRGDWPEEEKRWHELDTRKVLQELGLALRNHRDEINEIVRVTLRTILLFHPSSSELVQRKWEANDYRRLGEDMVEKLVRFLAEQSYLLMLQSGEEGGLNHLIRKCRSRVFNEGVIGMSIQTSNLVIVPPQQLFLDKGEKEMHQLFRQAALTELGVVPTVSEQTGQGAVIYFEDLFHPADEIDKIQDYYQSYIRKKKEERAFYHFHRRAVELDDIVLVHASEQPVMCGNPGCRRDIRLLDRSMLFCPACKGPIWNRCGNTGCTADDLQTRLSSRLLVEEHGGSPPAFCPECSGAIRTWWWRCQDGQHTKNIPSDKASCPECLEEYRKGVRSYEAIGKRSQIMESDCPGCLHIKKESSKARKVPTRLAPYYREGINGHDSLKFKQLAREAVMDEHMCLEASVSHYLFPTCPITSDGALGVHHLYRNSHGHFVCPQHPKLRFYICFHCEYPVRVDREKKGAAHCPRCLRELRWCLYCSDRHEKLYTPQKSDNHGLSRCPNCENLMSNEVPAEARAVEEGLDRPSYCRNLFRCQASVGLWHTASEFRKHECHACRGEVPAQLQERFDLERLVKECPFCLTVLGTPERGLVEKFDAVRILEAFTPRLEKRTIKDFCQVCGTETLEVLRWMETTGYFTPIYPEVEGEEQRIPAEARRFQELLGRMPARTTSVDPPLYPYGNALEIYQILRDNLEDEQAYRKLKMDEKVGPTINRLLPMNGQDRGYVRFGQDLLKVFRSETVTSKGLEERLTHIGAMCMENLSREAGNAFDHRGGRK